MNSIEAVIGDVFDLIWPRDSKRFVPHILDERLVGLDNLLQATIDLAVKELEPYADLIAMIGVSTLILRLFIIGLSFLTLAFLFCCFLFLGFLLVHDVEREFENAGVSSMNNV